MRKNNWQLLSKPYDSGLGEVLNQHYFGAQLIAMAGRHLIGQRNDDSNTSMVYDPKGPYLMGEPIEKGYRVVLGLNKLSLALIQHDLNPTLSVPLVGLTLKEGFNKLSQMLNEVGVKTSNLKNELHYELPNHGLLSGTTFQVTDPVNIQEVVAHRHNAEVLLIDVVADYRNAEPVRIWPHHFDTGTLIPLDQDLHGDFIRSAGLGWAIPDGMVDEPYYYLSIWSKDPLDLPTKMPPLKRGTWMMPGWNGAVLRLSEILLHDSAEDQYASVLSFFKSGIQIINDL